MFGEVVDRGVSELDRELLLQGDFRTPLLNQSGSCPSAKFRI
jgi:hypothetical protein